MIGRLAALILLSTVYLIQTAEDPQQISLTVAELGGNVSLKCPFSGKEARFFSWYRLPLGFTVQTVATGTYDRQTLDAKFNNTRFKLTEQKDHFLLIIRNVSKDDEATYFCQSGTAYLQSFTNVIYLAVNDHNQKKGGNMKQTPETTSVRPGDLVTLQCSFLSMNNEKCPRGNCVYWFRAGSRESPPAIVYRNMSDEEKERSCGYSLSKTIRDSSDTGTYYCAVVACGKILFGEGTKVKTGSEMDPVVLVLGGLLACCVIVITVLIVYINRRRVCEHCKEGKNAPHNPEHHKSTVDQSAALDDDAEAVNYAALDFSTRRAKKAKKNKASPEECVYSAVRGSYR